MYSKLSKVADFQLLSCVNQKLLRVESLVFIIIAFDERVKMKCFLPFTVQCRRFTLNGSCKSPTNFHRIFNTIFLALVSDF